MIGSERPPNEKRKPAGVLLVSSKNVRLYSSETAAKSLGKVVEAMVAAYLKMVSFAFASNEPEAMLIAMLLSRLTALVSTL